MNTQNEVSKKYCPAENVNQEVQGEQDEPINLTGKHVAFQTRGIVEGGSAIYYRVKVVKDTPNLLAIKYVSKSNPDPKKVDWTTESIKKSSIVGDITVYKD